MTGRLKFLATAALGLVIATGTLADVSAKTVMSSHRTHQAHVAKTHTTRIATKGHRLHLAHLSHAHKPHVARHQAGHRLVKASGIKNSKEAGAVTTHRERHAANHRVANKPVTIVR